MPTQIRYDFIGALVCVVAGPEKNEQYKILFGISITLINQTEKSISNLFVAIQGLI